MDRRIHYVTGFENRGAASVEGAANISYSARGIPDASLQIPFVDRLVAPIIPDEATQMAALRTGKLDLHQLPPATQWAVLDKAPGIQSAEYSIQGMCVAFAADEPPFEDWSEFDILAADGID